MSDKKQSEDWYSGYSCGYKKGAEDKKFNWQEFCELKTENSILKEALGDIKKKNQKIEKILSSLKNI